MKVLRGVIFFTNIEIHEGLRLFKPKYYQDLQDAFYNIAHKSNGLATFSK